MRADEPVIITPVEQPDPTTADSSAPQDGPSSDAPPAAEVSGSDLPQTVAEATATDPADPVSADNPLSSVTVHEGVLVRLRDVYAHIENWAARHPEISRLIGYDLKSALGTVERVGPNGEAAPVGDTSAQETATSDAEPAQ